MPVNQTQCDIDRIIRLPELKDITGLSRSGLYSQIKASTFPAPVPIGSRAVGWLLSDVRLWLESRKTAFRKEVA